MRFTLVILTAVCAICAFIWCGPAAAKTFPAWIILNIKNDTNFFLGRGMYGTSFGEFSNPPPTFLTTQSTQTLSLRRNSESPSIINGFISYGLIPNESAFYGCKINLTCAGSDQYPEQGCYSYSATIEPDYADTLLNLGTPPFVPHCQISAQKENGIVTVNATINIKPS